MSESKAVLEAQKHLKCDNERPVCGRCQKNGQECVRGVRKIKFRHGSSARYDSGFLKNQTWLKIPALTTQLDYVDETADIVAFYAQDPAETDSETDSNVDGLAGSLTRRQGARPTTQPNNEVSSSSRDVTGDAGISSPDPQTPRVSPVVVFGSPAKRRKLNDFGNLSSNTLKLTDLTAQPVQPPALSWLDLHTPLDNVRRLSTASKIGPIPNSNSNFDIGPSPFPLPNLDFERATPQNQPFTINPASATLENVPSTPSYFPSPFSPNLHRPPEQYKSPFNETWTWESPTLRESVLMRYFIDHLAHWFDLCDQERHFQLVVPQRARHCPPLLNAIFTSSARHLTRLNKFKMSTNVDGFSREAVVYAGNVLPDLRPETAIQYHNESIKDLMQLSMQPEQVHNENLLAAAIILRFHEEVDAPLRVGTAANEIGGDINDEDVDNELFLKVTNTFLNAQQPALAQLPHSSPIASLNAHARADSIDSNSFPVFQTSPASLTSPPAFVPQHHHNNSMSTSDPTPRVPRADGLRQACFWVAFRQEVTVAFLKQRPFGIPLSRCSAFRSFSAAEDAVWADRLIIFCADVLQFCNGGVGSDFPIDDHLISEIDNSPRRTRNREQERWDKLQATLKKFSTVLPKSFEPIYFRAPDPTFGEVFPEIWYLDAVHVTGIQHVELARILLAASNPYIPRLGPGHVAAMNKLSLELQSIVLRLCGMALSNRRTPPGLVTAYMAVAMCGEHFSRRSEQEALIGVLKELEDEHTWPTEGTRGSLKQAWGWND